MTNPKAPEDPFTTLAVAVGRLETGQKFLLDGFKEISEAIHAVPVIRRDVDALQEWRKSAEARKPPWTAIAAVAIAAFSLAKQLLGF